MMAFSILIFSLMTLSTIQKHNIQHMSLYPEYCHAECRVCFGDMLSAIFPSVIMLNVVMLGGIMLTVVAPFLQKKKILT
jgi:hypothetical protein